MISREPFRLTAGEHTISGELYLPPITAPPCVITCHGLFSSKKSDKFAAIANRFPRSGIAVALFDFAGCGESSGAIAETTASGRLRDLTAVFGHVNSHPRLGGPLGILGSSFGGFVSLFFAARHPVQAMSLWSTPCTITDIFHTVPPRDLNTLTPSFFSDTAGFDPLPILNRLHTVQIIQGKQDTIVPASHADEIISRVNNPKELILFPSGDHSISRPSDRESALKKSLLWFKIHLR
jgi:alpha-beta hydrolase superfamily lysophospholipase